MKGPCFLLPLNILGELTYGWGLNSDGVYDVYVKENDDILKENLEIDYSADPAVVRFSVSPRVFLSIFKVLLQL